MENLTSAEVKKILAPILDFDKRSATMLYSETLPPEVQKAISEKRALVGMDRDQVLLAHGASRSQVPREQGRRRDLEDWIFGTPPGKIIFVTFTGNKVIKVKEEYAGLGSQTRAQRIPYHVRHRSGFRHHNPAHDVGDQTETAAEAEAAPPRSRASA